MTVLGTLFRKGISVTRLEPDERARLLLADSGADTVAGISVAPATALQAVAVYAATSLIAQTVASLPIEFIERGDESREKKRPEQIRALWTRPNADQTIESFIETAMLSILLWGNFYAAVGRNNRGDIIELWPIDPDRIQDIERMTDRNGRHGLRFRVQEAKPEWVENPPGQPVQILHIPGLTLPGRIKGLSVIEQAAETIGFTRSAQQTASRFLGDGTHLSGVLSTEAELDQDGAKELWDNWQLQHKGPKKAGRVAVIGGGAKFEGISIPPSDLQFIEQMKYGDNKIASLYRVPPHMVGDVERSTSWGSGLEEQTKGFVQYTLTPWMVKIEQAVARTLLPQTSLEMKFNVNGLLRGSAKDRAEFYSKMVGIGVYSQNDIRRKEDDAPVADGDERYVPMNWRPMSEPFQQPGAGAAAAGGGD